VQQTNVRKESYLTVSVVIAFAALIVSIISLYYSVKSFRRDENYSAVITSDSVKELHLPISYCNLIHLNYMNLSKYPAPLGVTITSRGLSLHQEMGEYHPPKAYFYFTSYPVIIKPNGLYSCAFRVHKLKNPPENVVLTIYTNGIINRQINYSYNQDSGTYYYQNETRLKPRMKRF
jgi:hypothetical protein